MKNLQHLLAHNRAWARDIELESPGFFENLEKRQAPHYLWIGCSDSRVPAETITGTRPGELFVHRNIANQVLHTDFNCLSVIQFAVQILKIRHIIVCGHYDCGGVKAALEGGAHGLIDNWLRHLQEIYRWNYDELRALAYRGDVVKRLCELNVVRQALNIGETTIVQHAWRAGQEVIIHGWIYSLADGLLKDLGLCVSSLEELEFLEMRLHRRQDG